MDAIRSVPARDGRSREEAERVLRAFLECRRLGDVEGMLRHVAETVVFERRGAWTVVRYAAPRRGKAEYAEVLRSIHILCENLGSEFHELVVEENRAALHRTVTLRNRGTGETHVVGFCDFIRFEDGLIAEIAEYPDSAALEALQGETL